MEYSANMIDLINNSRYTKSKLISMHLESEGAEEIDENLENWEVTSITPTVIEFSLTYKDPLQVSSGWQND